MTSALTLAEVLENWAVHELDDSLYVREGHALELDETVVILPFDRDRARAIDGYIYLLGIEQIRDAVIGLEQQLGRPASPTERLRAVRHFAGNDAFIDPKMAADP